MLEALLVGNQEVDIGNASASSGFFAHTAIYQDWASASELLPISVSLWEIVQRGQRNDQSNSGSLVIRQTPAGTQLTTSASALRAMEQVAEMRKQRRERNRVGEELKWIAANRGRFGGQWVALDGDKLVAIGQSAREVSDAAKGQTQNPLVVYLESNPKPFAGW